MTEVEDLIVKVAVEDDEVITGTDRVIKNLNKMEDAAKETSIEFGRMGNLLGSLTAGALGFGAAIVGALTGGLIASPQFKQFVSSLQEPFNRLSRFMGQTFAGALKEAENAFRRFVNFATTDEGFKSLLDLVSEGVEAAFNVTADILFGTEESKGLFTAVIDILTGTLALTKDITLSLGVDADTTTRALLAGALALFGGPIGVLLAGAIVGQTLQEKFGDPETFRVKAADALTGGGFSETVGAFRRLDELESQGVDIGQTGVGLGGSGTALVTLLLRLAQGLNFSRPNQTVMVSMDQPTIVPR